MRHRLPLRVAALLLAALLLPLSAVAEEKQSKITYGYDPSVNAVEIVRVDGTLTGTVEPLAFVSVGSVGNVQPVAVVANKAFQGQREMTEFVVPPAMTAIAPDAFIGCDALVRFTVQPNNPRYKDIDGVLYAADGSALLLYPPGRKDATYAVADGATAIADGAFANQTTLTQIALPKGLKRVGKEAFAGCTSLTSIAFPEGVETLSEGALRECSALVEVTLPASLRTIGASALLNCSSVTALSLPEKLSGIGANALQGMASLTSLHIPAAVKRFGKDAFKGVNAQFTVKKESSAQRYLKKNGIPYRRIDGDMLATSVTLTGEDAVVSGKSVKLKAEVLPKKATQKVTYTSSNEAAATVDASGRVTATKAISEAVQVVITATTTDGTDVSASHSLVVLPQVVAVHIYLNGVDVTGQTVAVSLDETPTLTATIRPEGASHAIKWTSGNTKLAKVALNGTVKPLRRGTVTITVRALDGSKVSASVKLSIQNPPAKTPAPLPVVAPDIVVEEEE